MVDADIITAPAAGERTIPAKARTPAASGTEMMLYPVAHTRFCHIFR